MPKPNDTKRQLEIQALRFFAEHDYERSSLNDIAEALGVTKGAIYHYFSSKEDLFLASVGRLLQLMEDQYGEIPSSIAIKDYLESLFRMDEVMEKLGTVVGLSPTVTVYKNMLYLFLASMKKFPEIQNRIKTIYRSFELGLRELLEKGIERNEIRADTDTEAVAFEITAFYEGALLLDAVAERKDFAGLGPRVFSSIWKRIAADQDYSEGGKLERRENP